MMRVAFELPAGALTLRTQRGGFQTSGVSMD